MNFKSAAMLLGCTALLGAFVGCTATTVEIGPPDAVIRVNGMT